MKRRAKIALLLIPFLTMALSGCIVYDDGPHYPHHYYWR
jgi:hypothetical protein